MAAPVGLARKTLSAGALFFFAVGASAPMTVVAGGMVATYAGTGVVGVPAAFALITIALALFTVGYVAMARHVPHAGPFYAHVARGLGPARGLGIAPIALLAYNAIQISLYGLLGVVVAGLLGGAWWAWALVAWALVAILGVLHVAVNARLLALLLVAEIGVVLAFDLAAFTHPDGGAVSFAPLLPSSLFQDGAGGVFGLSVAAFMGYESVLAYGEEARSHRAAARATVGSLVFIGVLYAVSSWAMAVAVGPDHVVAAARDPGSGIPLSIIEAHYGRPLAILAALLLVTSVFAAMLSFHSTVARYVFVLSRERVLPAALGTIGHGARAGAPIGGSLPQSALGLRHDDSPDQQLGRARSAADENTAKNLRPPHLPRRHRRPPPHPQLHLHRDQTRTRRPHRPPIRDHPTTMDPTRRRRPRRTLKPLPSNNPTPAIGAGAVVVPAAPEPTGPGDLNVYLRQAHHPNTCRVPDAR